MAEVALFVYGTLRVGEGNYPMIARAVKRADIGCTTSGVMHWVFSNSGYPVVNFKLPGTIVGDILYVEEMHPNLVAVNRMELGAGYDIAEIEVNTPEGRTVRCHAYHYGRKMNGQQIESGNWVEAYRLSGRF